MRNKLISVILVLCVIMSLVQVPAFAATDGIFTYEVMNGEAVITDCDENASGEVVIPLTIGGYSVRRIGKGAFSGCREITSIAIPDSVTNILTSAFSDCSSLTYIRIPDGVSGILDYTFVNCVNLTNVVLSPNTTIIASNAFRNCRSLKALKIPRNVRTIGEYAFSGCLALKNITIPNSVTGLGEYAFENCSSMLNVSISGSGIGNNVFYGCKMLNFVSVSTGATRIGVGAFSLCTRLKKIILPQSIKYIDSFAFQRCDSLKDVYYEGTEEEWKKIRIAINNNHLTEATIHYNYNPDGSDGIDIRPEAVDGFIPTGINKVTINGKGSAYGRFEILDFDGNNAKNMTVHYSIDGGEEKSVVTDRYGYANISIDGIEESRIYNICFIGDGIYTEEELEVVVKPLYFKTECEGEFKTGVKASVGLGVGGSIGSLEAKASVAEAGVEGSNKKTIHLSQEYVDNKNKISVVTKQNFEAAVEAKAGLFAEAKASDDVTVKASIGDIHGNASYGVTMGMGYEDDDFDINDKNDILGLSKFMLASYLENMTSNVATRYIAKTLEPDINFREIGSSASLGGGAELGVIGVEAGDVEAEVSLVGLDTATVWKNSVKTFDDDSTEYSTSVDGETGTKLFNAEITVNDVGTGYSAFGDSFINSGLELTAKKDGRGNLSEILLSSEMRDDDKIFLYKKTNSEKYEIKYENDTAQEVVGAYDKLQLFTDGEKRYFSMKEYKKAVETMTDNYSCGKYSVSEKVTEGFEANISASAQLLVEIGGEVGVAGTMGYEYETKTGIYENGTAYIQAENDIAEDIDAMVITFGDIVDYTKDTIKSVLSDFWNTVSGWIGDTADATVDAGKAVVKGVGQGINKIKVSVKKLFVETDSLSVLAVSDMLALFSTSSVAVTVGEPYIISAEDEDGNAITDFSDSPLLLELKYTAEDLSAAGVTDISQMSILRWDNEKCVYVKMGGALDEENMCMTLEITKPGQYILAVDNCPPAITQFEASRNTGKQEFFANVSDMSGISDFVFTINEDVVVSYDVLQEYYDFTRGIFRYTTDTLDEGLYTATIYAVDSFGNEVYQSIDFEVSDAVPVIGEVSKLNEILTENTYVTANIYGGDVKTVLLNIDTTSPRGEKAHMSTVMTFEDGVYKARIPNIKKGYTADVWVSAYNSQASVAISEKQSTLSIPCQSGECAIAITDAGDNSAMIRSVGVPENENAVIYVATYNRDGVLTEVRESEFADGKTFEFSADTEVIKAFLWDCETMTPLCDEFTLYEGND